MSRGCGDVRTSVDVDVPGPTTVPCVRAINWRASKISLAHTTGAPANCNTGFLPAVTAATPSFRSILLRYVPPYAARGRKGRSARTTLPCTVRPLPALPRRPLGNLAPRTPPTADTCDYMERPPPRGSLRHDRSGGEISPWVSAILDNGTAVKSTGGS